MATGCGKDLPAILVLDSMQDKRSIIVLERGQEKIIFPGRGQVKMELPPGTKVMPTTKLPSGHLSIRCDHFGAAGKPASSSSTTTFKTELIGDKAPEQGSLPRGQRGNLPHALLAVMAKAAARGDQVEDLETFEAFVARYMDAGRPLPNAAIERRVTR